MTEEPEVVDAEVVDEEPQPPPAGTELVATAEGVMMPFEAEEVSAAMRAYQRTVAATLSKSDWQIDGDTRFVKKSGWRKIAKAFGLSVTRVDDGVERDDKGEPVRAWAVYRAAHPNGQTQDGDGYCSVDEKRFANWKGRQKLENDLRATATTRAKNRAISDLVGMGEVSAEEIEANQPPPVQPFTADLSDTWKALEGVIESTETVAALRTWIIKDNGGIIPASVGRTLVALGRCFTPAPAELADPTGDDNPPF